MRPVPAAGDRFGQDGKQPQNEIQLLTIINFQRAFI